jgi:hypothetical protein
MAQSKTIQVGGLELNRLYMIIWAVLLGLTLVEVAIPEMAMNPNGPKDLAGITI